MADKYIIKRLRVLFVILLSIIPVTLFAAPARVTAVQVVPASGYVRVIFSIADPHQCDVFTLNNPNRVVVDFEESSLRTHLRALHLPDVLFKRARSGIWKPGILRVVFDMKAAVRAKGSLHVDADEKRGKLIVDIYPESRQLASKLVPAEVIKPTQSIRPKATLEQKPQAATRVNPPVPAVAKKPVPAAVNPAANPPVKTGSAPLSSNPLPPGQLHTPLVEAPKAHQLIVVIDAGHGGKDSGTIGRRGTLEKQVVLATAVRLAELINQEPNMRAVLTRKGDYFITLKDRLAIARNNKADLFIAIHADSYFDNQSTGASVYALSPHGASSTAARWLADKENHSEMGGVDLNDKSYALRSVLIDLAQTATIADSIRLGTDILTSLETVTTLHNRRVDQAPFVVLKSPDISSVLVETGFLSNPTEEDRLREAEYRDKLAQALLAGIRHYADLHPIVPAEVKQAAPLVSHANATPVALKNGNIVALAPSNNVSPAVAAKPANVMPVTPSNGSTTVPVSPNNVSPTAVAANDANDTSIVASNVAAAVSDQGSIKLPA